MRNPTLSVIVVNWNTCELLSKCLHSVIETAVGLDYDIWVVDNASTDGSLEMLARLFPQVHVIANDTNLGFATANNQALTASRGTYALLFNSDAVALPGSIQRLLMLAENNPRVGIVGAHLLNPDGSFQASHSPFPNLRQEILKLSGFGRRFVRPRYPSYGPDDASGPKRADYVEGACMLARRMAIEQVGGLDPDYFMYNEEVDWCLSMYRAGWEVWYEPQARIIHFGGGSTRRLASAMEAQLYGSRVRFFRKHYGDWQARALKALIYLSLALKGPVYWLLRLCSRGRRGRHMSGWGELHRALRGM